MTAPVTLTARDLTLSTPTLRDVDAVFDACQDPDVLRFTTLPSPYEREDAKAFVARAERGWASGTEAHWVIRDASRGLLGVIGLYAIARGNAELGYWVAAEARGRGVARTATAAVLEWALDPEGGALVRIAWHAVTSNVASARVARAAGFRFEGRQRRSMVNGSGVREDGWAAAILSTDAREPQVWPVQED